MAGLKLELDERAKQKLMEYLAEKISRRSLREGFALPLNHRFLITTVHALMSLSIFPRIKILRWFRIGLFFKTMALRKHSPI